VTKIHALPLTNQTLEIYNRNPNHNPTKQPTVVRILAIFAPFRGVFTATIYRGISWSWRYSYRR